MTPIYRSPDQKQTQAMQSLLLEQRIQASIIETKKSKDSDGSSSVTWYELWLRNYADVTRAKSIITQHEFTTYKTSMSSYRTAVQAQQLQEKVEFHNSEDTFTAVQSEEIVQPIVLEEQPVSVKEAPKPREDLIPINNKRVFKRLGLLLGFSEEEIQKFDDSNNKLYRPWDGNALMESVKNLKQKCS
jgi:hypothetical protein